jgi:hypothetical protein
MLLAILSREKDILTNESKAFLTPQTSSLKKIHFSD